MTAFLAETATLFAATTIGGAAPAFMGVGTAAFRAGASVGLAGVAALLARCAALPADLTIGQGGSAVFALRKQ